jgi:hypothetical protein
MGRQGLRRGRRPGCCNWGSRMPPWPARESAWNWMVWYGGFWGFGRRWVGGTDWFGGRIEIKNGDFWSSAGLELAKRERLRSALLERSRVAQVGYDDALETSNGKGWILKRRGINRSGIFRKTRVRRPKTARTGLGIQGEDVESWPPMAIQQRRSKANSIHRSARDHKCPSQSMISLSSTASLKSWGKFSD